MASALGAGLVIGKIGGGVVRRNVSRRGWLKVKNLMIRRSKCNKQVTCSSSSVLRMLFPVYAMQRSSHSPISSFQCTCRSMAS